ncbi:hypothetical protein niasHT_039052 [Heterodera trifolii]|uniref:G-protein coupled receptors family 1 profile domain-containing protein n=1 Tax=Heterodera trifolii TaxID=157864 RepID=A0ABD2HU70_9BILA
MTSIFTAGPVALAGGEVALALIMIASNGLLVFVTLKAKNLDSTCNWLIAANSACISLYASTFFIQFGIFLLRPSGIPLLHCCLLAPVPLFFLCCQNVLFPLIALDRLFGAIVPLKQMGRTYKCRFLLFALIASSSYGSFMVSASFNKSIINLSENLVLCMTPDPAPAYFSDCNWMLNICSVVLYLALWVRVKVPSSSSTASSVPNATVSRRVTLSLLLIFAVETFGWVSNWSVRLALAQFGASESTKWHVMSFCAYSLQLSLSLNGPILLARSYEYRKAFQAAFFPPSSKPSFVQIVHQRNGKTMIKPCRN